jgi:hypothetical protein
VNETVYSWYRRKETVASRNRSRAVALLALLFAFTACSPDGPAPKPSIDENRFVEYYASFMVLSHQLKLEGYDSLGIAHGLDTLRRSFKLEQADIGETFDYYHRHLPQWREFNTRLLKRLEEIQKNKGKM